MVGGSTGVAHPIKKKFDIKLKMKRFTDKRKKPERMFSDLIKRQIDR